jgi:hypothetical protein
MYKDSHLQHDSIDVLSSQYTVQMESSQEFYGTQQLTQPVGTIEAEDDDDVVMDISEGDSSDDEERGLLVNGVKQVKFFAKAVSREVPDEEEPEELPRVFSPERNGSVHRKRPAEEAFPGSRSKSPRSRQKVDVEVPSTLERFQQLLRPDVNVATLAADHLKEFGKRTQVDVNSWTKILPY